MRVIKSKEFKDLVLAIASCVLMLRVTSRELLTNQSSSLVKQLTSLLITCYVVLSVVPHPQLLIIVQITHADRPRISESYPLHSIVKCVLYYKIDLSTISYYFSSR